VSRLNERLSFLRYGEGNFFGPHCDGPLELPDGRHAYVTLQIYLGADGVEGGATRLYGYQDRVFDVEPKKGRVLIFQQRNVYHSGEKVTKGVKYALRSDFMFRRLEA
jgi:predicted 2-oxoglutarate/Fe(II)-dependent dioxygenase YbiX